MSAAESLFPIASEVISGKVYAVSVNGDNLYRGRCIQDYGYMDVAGSKKTIHKFFLIDQGQEEIVQVSSVRILPRHLEDYPSVTHRCTIHSNFQSERWTNDHCIRFKQLTKRSPMNLKVISIHDDLLEIDLYEIVSCAEAVVSVRETLFPTVNQLLSVPTRKKYKPKFGDGLIEDVYPNEKYSVFFVDMGVRQVDHLKNIFDLRDK